MAEEEPMVSPGERLILIVDDDDHVRDLVEMAATMEGFRVITAIDGNDASQKLQSDLPDLIITDLMMTGQGGYEFLRSLQAAGNGLIPVFVMTGSKLDASTFQLIREETNVVEFFTKPIRVIPFMSAVHKRLNTAPPGTKLP